MMAAGLTRTDVLDLVARNFFGADTAHIEHKLDRAAALHPDKPVVRVTVGASRALVEWHRASNTYTFIR